MLNVAQTIGKVGTMVLTSYFSKKQIQGLSIEQQMTIPHTGYIVIWFAVSAYFDFSSDMSTHIDGSLV